MKGEMIGFEGRVPEEEVPLEVQDDLINGVIFLVHNLFSDLFKKEAEGNALVEWLSSQQFCLEIDDLVEYVTVLGSTYFCQLFYLEDIQQMLKGQKLELLPKVLPQVLFREKDDRDTFTVYPHQRL